MPDNIPLSVNSPVVSLRVVDRNRVLTSQLSASVELDFRLLTTQNRTNPWCVYWQHDPDT